MADILVIGTSIVDVATVALRDAIAALGHTPTLIADGALAGVNVAPYGAIACTRLTSALAATNGPIIRGWIQSGKPVLFGLSDQGYVDGTTPSFVATVAGLMGTGLVDAPGAVPGTHNDEVVIVNNAHAVTAGLALGTLSVNGAGPGEWQYAVGSGQPYAGTLLANGDAHSNRVAGQAVFVATEVGTAYVSGGGTLGARVVLAGFLYRSAASVYTASGLDLIDRSIDWLLLSPSKPTTPTLAATTTQKSVTLTGSAFSDPQPSDTHGATRWQLTYSTDTGFLSPRYDSGAAGEAALLSKTLGCLPAGTSFLARAQYQDSGGVWSDWSVAVAFSTLPAQEPERAIPSSSLW